MISIIHPSRSRPEKAYTTVKKWLREAGCDVEYILSLDQDDPMIEKYNYGIGMCAIHKNRSAIDAVNNAAKLTTGNILIQISDDFDCPPLWGEQILDATQGKSDWLLKVSDGTQGWIATLPIMDRVFYEANGYVYYPEYIHMFCDTDLTHKADIQKKIIWRNDIKFDHQHYSTGKNVKDSVSNKADLTWNQGERLYLNRCREKFGTGLDIWNISESGAAHKNWLRKKLR